MLPPYVKTEYKKILILLTGFAGLLLIVGLAVYAYTKSGGFGEGQYIEKPSLVELQSLNSAVNAFGSKDSFKDENLNKYLEARLNRLTYITSHKKETEYYLVSTLLQKDTQEYKGVLKEYALSDFTVVQEGVEGKTPVTEYLIQAKRDDEKNKTDYFQTTASYYLSPYDYDAVAFVDGTTAVVTLVNDANSGSYNIDTYVYTVKIENNRVEKTMPTLVFYNEKTKQVEKVKNTWSMSESNLVRQLDGTNVGYDEKSKKLITTPHRPFGMYPCSEVQYYDVYFDRLVLDKTEIPEYCVGRDFTSPDAGDFKKLPNDGAGDEFVKQKTLYQATPAELDMARKTDLGKL